MIVCSGACNFQAPNISSFFAVTCMGCRATCIGRHWGSRCCQILFCFFCCLSSPPPPPDGDRGGLTLSPWTTLRVLKFYEGTATLEEPLSSKTDRQKSLYPRTCVQRRLFREANVLVRKFCNVLQRCVPCSMCTYNHEKSERRSGSRHQLTCRLEWMRQTKVSLKRGEKQEQAVC